MNPTKLLDLIDGEITVSPLLALSVLTNKPQRIDGEHTVRLNDYDWRVKFAYRITQFGFRERFFFGGAVNPGRPHEVSIVRAWLLNKSETVETEIPVSIFPSDLLSDHETEIAQQLDAEQE